MNNHAALRAKFEAQCAERPNLPPSEIARLRALLSEAIEDIESWGEYASDYWKEKHGLYRRVAWFRQAAQSPDHSVDTTGMVVEDKP